MTGIKFIDYLIPNEIYLIVFESSYRTGSGLLLPIYNGGDMSFRAVVTHFDETINVFVAIHMNSDLLELIGNLKNVTRISFYTLIIN